MCKYPIINLVSQLVIVKYNNLSNFQPVQPMIQVPTSGTVQQPGPSTPRTPTQTTAPISAQATTPIPGVSGTPISTAPQVSQQSPVVSTPKPGPTVQTTVQMPT